VLYRPDLPAGTASLLRDLADAAVDSQAPVIVAPRRQDPALVAVANGERLTCDDDGAEQAAAARFFAASRDESIGA
jgi:hypothetical protein